MAKELTFYQLWIKSLWFRIPFQTFKWSGMASLLSLVLMSIYSAIDYTVVLGSPSPIPSGIKTVTALPILIFILSIFGMFLSWMFALMFPLFVSSGISIAADYNKITKNK